MQRIIGIIMLASTAAAWAMVQESQPVFRVSTQRVVIEFIAVDNNGNIITDLDKNEVSIEFDGKKQKVERLIAPLAAVRKPPGGSAQADAGRPDAAQPGGPGLAPSLQQGPVRTTILLDSRALDASNFHHSRRAIRRFIAHSLQDDHFVMIAEIDRKLQILTPFTRDREALLRAVAELKPATLFNPLDTSRLRSAGAEYTDELLEQMTYLRSSMRVLMHSLSAYPGRKHVVLFSEGYPMNPVQELEFATRLATASSKSSSVRMRAARQGGRFKDPGVIEATREIVSWANTYGVSFYTVDARGLVGVPGLSADSAPTGSLASTARGAGLTSGVTSQGTVAINLFRQTVLGDIFDAQNFLLALAAGTNGSAFFNSNDLEAVLHASTREQRFVYLASVVPDLKEKDKVKFRRVKVQCKRKGTVIRAQAGFFNLDTRQLFGMRLAQALETPHFFKALQPVSEVKRKDGKVEVTFGIDGSQISFAAAENGMKRIEMVFVGQIFKKGGGAAFKALPIQRPFAMDLTAEQYSDLTSQPLVGHQELDLPAGRYRLVFVVEDRIAGAMGAREIEFEVH